MKFFRKNSKNPLILEMEWGIIAHAIYGGRKVIGSVFAWLSFLLKA